MYELLVEVFFIVFGEGLVFLVVGYIFFVSCVGIIFSGCVFESVRFVQFDRFYIFVGLRNGMFLCYEWLVSFIVMFLDCMNLLLILDWENIGII